METPLLKVDVAPEERAVTQVDESLRNKKTTDRLFKIEHPCSQPRENAKKRYCRMGGCAHAIAMRECRLVSKPLKNWITPSVRFGCAAIASRRNEDRPRPANKQA
jgi:hypothetical protein